MSPRADGLFVFDKLRPKHVSLTFSLIAQGSLLLRSPLLRRLKSQLQDLKARTAVNAESLEVPSEDRQSKEIFRDQNPVERYYEHRIKTAPRVFSRFALQSRSLAIRDIFARAATKGRHDLNDLLVTLEARADGETSESDRTSFEAQYDAEILLTLADLLSNTARSDIDTHAAVQIYDLVYSRQSMEVFQDHHKLQYVEALNEIGRYDDVDSRAAKFSLGELVPLQHELLNIQSIRRTGSSSDWLIAMNDLYASLDMSQIQVTNDDETVPLLDRLKSHASLSLDGPKVSVIMPTFSPGSGIWTALRSILEQTWKNIEVIVVDDASPQEYQDLFSKLEELDPRIQVIRQPENAGAYVARNAGLALATGAYVTTHDDDDWSHPDKIATQVSALERQDSVVATTSAHIRTTQDMDFQRVNIHARYLQMNYSSLMFRKSITADIGPWDTVNRGGDSEFLNRVIENYGSEHVLELMDKPLSFSRIWAGSLTSGEMSRGFFANSRLLYRWAFRQWHWDMAKVGQKPVRKLNEGRPFAAPTTFEPGDRKKDLGLFDVIYVTDFFRQSKFVDFVINDIETLEEYGLRVGFLHLSSPQTDRPAGFPPRLFGLQHARRITQVSHDDIAETKLMIVYDASIGMFLDELKSSVTSRRGIVVDHELPTLSGAEKRKPTLIGQTLRYLDIAFGSTFQAVGTSTAQQDPLRRGLPNGRLLPDEMVWRTHVRGRPGVISPPRSAPMVGFHSYGNIYRWPTNENEFFKTYVSDDYGTRLYGQLDGAREKFGSQILRDVELVSLNQMDESEFLRSIDFWVYCPHYRLLDQVWGPVLSAMQAGKVVVLPARLKPIYGGGAVYANAHQVGHVVSHLTKHPDLYVKQAEQGQKLVSANFSREQLRVRIEYLIASRLS